LQLTFHLKEKGDQLLSIEKGIFYPQSLNLLWGLPSPCETEISSVTFFLTSFSLKIKDQFWKHLVQNILPACPQFWSVQSNQ